jgi:hypothetical protein
MQFSVLQAHPLVSARDIADRTEFCRKKIIMKFLFNYLDHKG